MAGDKYISIDGSGNNLEVASTDASAGAANAGDIIALDVSGKIDQSLLPAGIFPDILNLTASEAISQGAVINVWNDTGVIKMRNADAATGKRAHGYVKAAVGTGLTENAFFDGLNGFVTGLALGLPVYLSETPGQVTQTPVTTSGSLLQEVGLAHSTTSYMFEYTKPITRA